MAEPIRILLVEDNPIDRLAFQQMLARERPGDDCVVASSLAETRAILAALSPGDRGFDLALVDYSLRDGTILEVFDEFLSRDIPITVTTGSGNENVAVEAMKAGALEYIIKDPDRNYLTMLPLVMETTLRRKAEERVHTRIQRERDKTAWQLQQLNQCYLSFGSVAEDNIQRLIALAGTVLQAELAAYYCDREEQPGACWQKDPGDRPQETLAHCQELWSAARHAADAARDAIVCSPLANGDTCARVPVGGGSRSLQGILCVVLRATEPDASDRQLLGIVATAIGIEEERGRVTQQLKRQASVDGLTQISNRRVFDETLLWEWQRSQRSQEPIALVLCDIDFFKSYNDACGHVRGDDCLCRVAATLQATLRRTTDTLARYGGEEFAILLPNTALDGARHVAERLRAAIDAEAIARQDSAIAPHITLSFGVAAIVPDADMSPVTLVNAADRALYQAKATGRDRVAVVETVESDC